MAELKVHLRESDVRGSAAYDSALCGREWAERLTFYAYRVTCKACLRVINQSLKSNMESMHATFEA